MRAVVVSALFLVVAVVGMFALWFRFGLMLGGLLGLMWVCALIVPMAFLVQRPDGVQNGQG